MVMTMMVNALSEIERSGVNMNGASIKVNFSVSGETLTSAATISEETVMAGNKMLSIITGILSAPSCLPRCRSTVRIARTLFIPIPITADRLSFLELARVMAASTFNRWCRAVMPMTSAMFGN